jgi:DNA-binding MarR family transcriptional regulator
MTETTAEHLAALLRTAGFAESHVESRLAILRLSLAKLAALQHLIAAGGTLALGQLADRLECNRSNVTQLVDRLEADGFVHRAPDLNDRRSRLAVITGAGRVVYEEGTRARTRAEQELFASLSAEEGEQLIRLMAKLDRAAGAR